MTKRYIVLEMLDYVSDADAVEFAIEINDRFQPHFPATVVSLPASAAQSLDLRIAAAQLSIEIDA
jgi:hypothetical protein